MFSLTHLIATRTLDSSPIFSYSSSLPSVIFALCLESTPPAGSIHRLGHPNSQSAEDSCSYSYNGFFEHSHFATAHSHTTTRYQSSQLTGELAQIARWFQIRRQRQGGRRSLIYLGINRFGLITSKDLRLIGQRMVRVR